MGDDKFNPAQGVVRPLYLMGVHGFHRLAQEPFGAVVEHHHALLGRGREHGVLTIGLR